MDVGLFSHNSFGEGTLKLGFLFVLLVIFLFALVGNTSATGLGLGIFNSLIFGLDDLLLDVLCTVEVLSHLCLVYLDEIRVFFEFNHVHEDF